MTRKTLTFTAAAVLLGTAAYAADADMSSIDANGDGVAEFSEFTALYPRMTLEIFETMDADRDGVVEQDEIRSKTTQAYLEDFGRNAGEFDVTVDLDGDGNVSLWELSEIVPGFPADSYAEMDRNGDGNLDLIEYNTAEAQAVLNAWEENVTFIRVSDYDADGDGILSVDELSVAVPGLDPADVVPIDSSNMADAGDRELYRPVAKIIK